MQGGGVQAGTLHQVAVLVLGRAHAHGTLWGSARDASDASRPARSGAVGWLARLGPARYDTRLTGPNR